MTAQTPRSTPTRLALTAVSTTLVCVATMVFSIYVPQTRGFFNLGETMIYVTALLFGPFIGSFAGGVGSSLADILLGFPHYAPATLVIKACEGGIVGILSRKKFGPKSKPLWRSFTLGMGLLIGALLGGIGSAYLSGPMDISLGMSPLPILSLSFTLPPELWYLLGALIVLLVALTGFVLEPEFGWLAFTTLVGGAIMVGGYFIYQKFLLFPLFGIADIVPEAEIPLNIGQMLIGLVIAMPIIKVLLRSFPQLKS